MVTTTGLCNSSPDYCLDETGGGEDERRSWVCVLDPRTPNWTGQTGLTTDTYGSPPDFFPDRTDYGGDDHGLLVGWITRTGVVSECCRR